VCSSDLEEAASLRDQIRELEKKQAEEAEEKKDKNETR
jgi:protein-arginine kinase activator protein McsA